MKLTLKLTKPTRRCKCHTPGCRNRDAYKITRRNDVNGNPLYLCADCIKETAAALGELEAAEKAKKQAIDAKIEAEIKAQSDAKAAEMSGVKADDEEQPHAGEESAESPDESADGQSDAAADASEEEKPQTEKNPAKPRSARKSGGKA